MKAFRRHMTTLLLLTSLVFGCFNTPMVYAAEDALTIGIFPRRNATLTTKLFSPLAEHLSRELGREVQLMTAKDFPAFWEGVEAGRYDIVHYNQYHYIKSANQYEVIASNEEFGESLISGSIFVRRDSGITRLDQLRGRSIIFGGGKDAMMSYIMPRYLLLQAGLLPGDIEEKFANSPPNSLLAVHYRQADAGGAGSVVINLPVVKKIIDTEDLVAIAESEKIVQLPWAIKRTLPEELKGHVQDLLVSLHESDGGLAILEAANLTGIHPRMDTDYDQCRAIIANIESSGGG